MKKDVYVNGMYVGECDLTTDSNVVLDLTDHVDIETVIEVKLTTDKVQIRTDLNYGNTEPS